MKTLDLGSRGNDVVQLQTILNAMWLTDSTLRFTEIDGVYGEKTRQAVIEFQRKAKANGLYSGSIDGIFGPKCWKIVGY